MKDAFYDLHHIKGFVQDAEKTRWPSSLQEWTKLSGEITDADLREDFHCIQMQLSQIIVENVMTEGGPYTTPEVGCIIKESLASLDRSASLFYFIDLST